MFVVDNPQDFFLGVGGMQHYHVAAVRHQVVGALVGEAEYVSQHFCFVFVYNALLGALVQNHFQLFLGHLPFFPVFQSDKPVSEFGRGAEEAYERVGYFGQDNHERAEQGGVALRVVQCHGFGNQLADNERQVGDDCHDGNHGEVFGIRFQPGNHCE